MSGRRVRFAGRARFIVAVVVVGVGVGIPAFAVAAFVVVGVELTPLERVNSTFETHVCFADPVLLFPFFQCLTSPRLFDSKLKHNQTRRNIARRFSS